MNSHGLTKENLVLTLPVALQKDESTVALAEAIAELLSRRPEEIERLLIYPAVEKLDEPLLDILAYDFKVDWWDADYTLEEKRRTLKSSWRVHKILGTKAAVERSISAIYPDTTVVEWFEYGGAPYHFQLRINISGDDVDSERMHRVLARLNYYKNLRSHNDGIHYFMEPDVQPTTRVWTGCPGLQESMDVPIPMSPLAPPHGDAVADVAIGAPGLYMSLTSGLNMERDAPNQTAHAGASLGPCGCHMRMTAIVAMP